jgi:glutathione synthase
MPMQVLDSSPQGLEARKSAQDALQVVDYVLKPNRDGGGHNIYRADIPAFLSTKSVETWHNFILMQLIEPPKTTGTVMTLEELYIGDVISELGILGTCLWRRSNGEGAIHGRTLCKTRLYTCKTSYPNNSSGRVDQYEGVATDGAATGIRSY